MKSLNEILKTVEKPARYIGGEYGEPNLELKKENSKFNYCVCFPDVYEVAMSNLGIRIVQEVINGVDGALADRCYAPWPDFGKALKENGIPLYSLGIKKPLKEFDMIGFSLQYEMSYTTILYMLDLAGIPLLASERDDSFPIIQGGGPCAVNPEPLACFFDLFVIGDGEISMRQLAELKLKVKDKKEFLTLASQIEGVYVPSITKPVYENGKIVKFEGNSVKRAICLDLETAPYPRFQPVGNIEVVHDRAVIEIMRGCYRGCRFCQAGFIYRPVRKRSVENLTNLACDLIKNTGHENISMNSLSTSDYTELPTLLKEMKAKLPEYTTIALPSLRIDNFESFYAEQSRKSSLTFAPEAGTQRLRNVINKDVTELDIETGVQKAFDLGISAIKLYFMMGLPTETEEDINGIYKVVEKVKQIYSQNPKRLRGLRINVSVSTFIPKPFTPFEWEAFATKEQVEQKIATLKQKLYIKGVSFNWNDYELSEMEAILARGDRAVGKVLLNAYKKGSYFESWCEYFNPKIYDQAFLEEGVNKSDYTSAQDVNGLLPWDFIDVGVTKKFLQNERKKAYEGKVTGGCQTGCKGCGLQGRCNIK